MKSCIISFAAQLVLITTTTKASDQPDIETIDASHRDDATLPSYFLGGRPAPLQEHAYRSDAEPSPHIASGPGLHEATTGRPASFTIELFDDAGMPILGPWSHNEQKFMYVWIANEDQILIAEVVDNGNGTLTATYESLFPGDYLVYVEEVRLNNHDEGIPVLDSPFRLTVTGAPKLDTDDLPACHSIEQDLPDSFWRPGTWVSSNIASPAHGVTRCGWVFQPKTCVLDTFSYEDLMYVASAEQPTWLLVLGSSIQRGVFLMLVDMILAEGQKDELESSTIQKCWGYAEVRVGNLRVTYQDMRLHDSGGGGGQKVICNNEKLASGSTAEFVRSCREFFSSTAFAKDTSWPTSILASSMVDHGPNLDVEVLLKALPSDWQGTLLFVDHLSGFGVNWHQRNPTMTRFEDVKISLRADALFGIAELEKIRSYMERDPRISFMSAFPIIQPMLFENEKECRAGTRKYGASQHLHCVLGPDPSRTHNGAQMVQSTVTEMVANILISKSVGPKSLLRSTFKSNPDMFEKVTTPGTTFHVCYDCPASLLPFHVKASPELTCTAVESLPESSSSDTFDVWNGELCPACGSKCWTAWQLADK
eukprot:g18416.t1